MGGRRREATPSAPSELLRALAVLAEPPGPEVARVAALVGLRATPSARDFTEVFLFQAHPYASVYLGPEGQVGGEARARIAGFWSALGYPVPPEPDHLAAVLGLYAALIDREDAAAGAERMLLTRAHRALLHEHLVPWLPGFVERVRELEVAPYADWAATLGHVLDERMSAAGIPDGLPAHLREMPPLGDPREEGAAGFTRELLAPARTGMIVTRRALGRCARDLGLGLRVGERRYVLDQLMGQDAPAVLRWLAGEAERQRVEHAARVDGVGPAAALQEERAARAATLLAALADEGAAAWDAAARKVSS